MEVKVQVVALVPNPELGSVLVVLREEQASKSEARMIPIYVGWLEGGAILMGVEKIKAPRPFTHDLFKNVLSGYAITVEKIVITDMKETTFYAFLYTKSADREIKVDARPSDAIAIALRLGCPIYVEDHVFEKANVAPQQNEDPEEAYGRMLDAMDPEKMPKA